MRTKTTAKILSETSEETKQRVKETANKLFMRQETLEEAAERLYPIIQTNDYMDWYDKNYDIRNSFIEGAKWQQERSYSEEEVIDILLLSYSSISDRSLAGADLRKWFEKFKK